MQAPATWQTSMFGVSGLTKEGILVKLAEGQWDAERAKSPLFAAAENAQAIAAVSVAKLKYPSVANRSIHLWPSEVPTFA